jgi:predicted transcriptional regulator YheO
MFIITKNENDLKNILLHQLMLAEFYKKQINNNENSVRVIGDIIPNPFFDLKDLKDERN